MPSEALGKGELDAGLVFDESCAPDRLIDIADIPISSLNPDAAEAPHSLN
jgi:hypothetical protein